MLKEFICINCPIGCELKVDEVQGSIIVSGNTCKIGEKYGKEEYIDPRRVVTTMVTLADGSVVAAKTDIPVKKDLIFEVIAEVAKLKPTTTPPFGTIIKSNIANTGANLIATGEPTSHKN